MKMIHIQEGYQKIFERQAQIPELQLHANGHCAHIGKISPGCLKCFVADGFYRNYAPAYILNQPTQCQSHCPYCVDDWSLRGPLKPMKEHWSIPAWLEEELTQHFVNHIEDAVIPAISFSGGGDPLLHFPVVRAYMKLFQRLESRVSRKPWYYLYTNGWALHEDMAKECRDLGFDEIRFHLGASDFSPKIYQKMAMAQKYIPTITVETPAWPLHRKALFEMLPKLEDLGVKHLNLGQVELNAYNFERIAQAYPEAEFYQILAYQMDDGGLVYEIMREVLDRGYHFSVLDCNGWVKLIQRGVDYNTMARQVAYDGTDLEGMVDFEAWRSKNFKK